MPSFADLDRELARRYGAYASYTVEDGPADFLGRLLDLYAAPGCTLLDVGCGAGLGDLLALLVTPANQQDRDQVQQLAQKVQEVTGDTVEVAFVDEGYTGKKPSRPPKEKAFAWRLSSCRK